MDRPIPLRPDPFAWREKERRSFNRAVAALAMTTRGGTGHHAPAAEVLKANWKDDDDAKQILKAATSPLTTSNFAAIQSTKFVEMLAPDCASAKLLNLGYKFDLSGINSIKLPFIGGGGRPAKPAFIAEGAPAPVVDLATSDAILGPTCKVLIQSAITGELQSASADTAEAIIGQALAISTEQSLDAALFSANAAVPGTSPAGILYGVPAVASGGATGIAGCAADIAKLAAAIGANGIAIDSMVLIGTPELATKARIYSGPHYNDAIFSSAYLPSGTLIGIVPAGLASGYQGQVDLETSLGATIVADDSATPPQIGTPGSPPVVGAPTLSAFQAYLIVVKVRARMAWCVQPGAVALVTGAAW
jgi:hypothetical protein